MTAMTAVAIEKFLSNPDRLMVDPELQNLEAQLLRNEQEKKWAGNTGLRGRRDSYCLEFRSPRPCPQQTVPDRQRQHDCKKADHEKRGPPALGLLLIADPDHDPGDVIGAAG